MKPRVVLPLLAVVSVVVLAAAVVFRPFPTTITRENAASIKSGIAYAEVLGILGPRRNEILQTEIPELDLTHSGDSTVGWKSESIDVRVYFVSGRVWAVIVRDTEFPSTQDYLLWRVRRSVGLPGHLK